jgi:hypothetical protein
VPVVDDGAALRLNAATLACITGTIAFAVYTRTLLPGVDLGDTGGFQAAVLWPETSARQGYPLYYLLARPFVAALSASNPARGLNLFSACCAAAAVGLLSYVAGLVVRSAAAGAAAGLLLAASYTFWTQAVIAEVYALHLALIAGCLVALSAYASRPTTTRLAMFFAIYAVSFGNHLTMILLFVPFAIFLLHGHPNRRELFSSRTFALCVLIVIAAALLYLPNLLFVLTNIDGPTSWSERIAIFWFDTTKADWRETMMLGVSRSELGDRLAMFLWDARQQFGAAGLALAACGAVRLWWISTRWAALVWSAYVISTIFAVTYNVGDAHVFFLPGHFLTAVAAAAALAPSIRPVGFAGPVRWVGSVAPAPRVIGVMLVLLYTGWRTWDTWPVVDRHLDRRADVLVARIATGLDDSNAVLLSDMEWQSENALLYSARYERPRLAWTRLADVMLHLPLFVRDNRAIGRDVVLSARAATEVAAAYGPLYAVTRDETPSSPSLLQSVDRIPRGAPYILTLLTPTADEPLDTAQFDEVLDVLGGNKAVARNGASYQVWAGVSGEKPAFHRGSNRPFRDAFSIAGDLFSVRMESWLPFDTFRRGGFGHVLRGGRHLMTLERGVSLLWFQVDGRPTVAYAASLYAPKPRFRISASEPQQVAAASGAILGRGLP